jgi:hypothetical protein
MSDLPTSRHAIALHLHRRERKHNTAARKAIKTRSRATQASVGMKHRRVTVIVKRYRDSALLA